MLPELVPYSISDPIRPIEDADECLSGPIRQAIDRLLKARTYADETGRNAWEFAVTISEIRRDGVSESDLRWLVCRGYAEHAKEVSKSGTERAFDRRSNLRFSKRTAFVITDAGAAIGREVNESFTPNEPSGEVRVRYADDTPQTVRAKSAPVVRRADQPNSSPKWDRDRRELRLGDELIKVFKLPSPMQEAILMAFEEEHWPPRIDDPLPVHPDLHPKRRLHDTIKSLNRNQKRSLIRFMGDGTGEGIRWELISTADLG